jgi:hypothetical protein
LERTPFGPPVPVEEDAVGQVVVKGDRPRRSVYLQARRTKPVPFLAAFDAPAMAVTCERRTPSTGAPRALVLMNGDFVRKHAGLFAARVRKEAPGGAGRPGQVAHAWAIAYGRPASPEEGQLACRFVTRQSARLRAAGPGGDPELAALTNLCQQLLSSNEFLYVD